MNKGMINLIWQFIDRCLMIVLQFFIGVKLANYLRAENYGKYMYAMSIVAFLQIFYEFFNKRIIIYYYLKKKNSIFFKMVGTQKVILSLVILLFLIFCNFFIKDKFLYHILILLLINEIGRNLIYKYELFYEANLNLKSFIIISNLLKIIFYLIQYSLILMKFSIHFIIAASILENFIKFIIFRLKTSKLLNNEYKKIKIKKVIKILIQRSWYLWMTYIYFLVFTQVDKIMIGNIINKKEVGIYSIAVQLAEVTAIFITPIQNTVYPILIKTKEFSINEYFKKWKEYNSYITYFYILIVIFSIPIIYIVFPFVFSNEYREAIPVSIILIGTVLFRANSCLRVLHITIFNLGNLILKLSLVGIIINTILNYFFIKIYGIKGAAISTLLTQILTANLLFFLFKKGKVIAITQLKSFSIVYFYTNIKNKILKRRYK